MKFLLEKIYFLFPLENFENSSILKETLKPIIGYGFRVATETNQYPRLTNGWWVLSCLTEKYDLIIYYTRIYYI